MVKWKPNSCKHRQGVQSNPSDMQRPRKHAQITGCSQHSVNVNEYTQQVIEQSTASQTSLHSAKGHLLSVSRPSFKIRSIHRFISHSSDNNLQHSNSNIHFTITRNASEVRNQKSQCRSHESCVNLCPCKSSYTIDLNSPRSLSLSLSLLFILSVN